MTDIPSYEQFINDQSERLGTVKKSRWADLIDGLEVGKVIKVDIREDEKPPQVAGAIKNAAHSRKVAIKASGAGGRVLVTKLHWNDMSWSEQMRSDRERWKSEGRRGSEQSPIDPVRDPDSGID